MTLDQAVRAFAGGEKPITKDRLTKLELFCKRFGLKPDAVIAACPPDVQVEIEALANDTPWAV